MAVFAGSTYKYTTCHGERCRTMTLRVTIRRAQDDMVPQKLRTIVRMAIVASGIAMVKIRGQEACCPVERLRYKPSPPYRSAQRMRGTSAVVIHQSGRTPPRLFCKKTYAIKKLPPRR